MLDAHPPSAAGLTMAPVPGQTAFLGKRMRSAEPDAELLRLGKVFEASWAVERELSAHLDASPEPDWEDLQEVAAGNTKIVAERILDLRATSFPGLLIKIRIASWCHSEAPIDDVWFEEAGIKDFRTTDVRSIASIMLDLAGMGCAAVPPSTPATARAA